ncbi:CehA/McbA family metallohydrolase [Bacillaceae bacterium Marseille-Q3522]|nr:CehA/McbA family metallohydrolase [Bacillaceae bacterium Marseille-Q3522]
MKKTIEIELFVDKEKEEQYLELPFDVPENVDRIDIVYDYQRYDENYQEDSRIIKEINIIDFALEAEDGQFLGASGSNRRCLWVSEYDSSAGFFQKKIHKGKWNIIVGAYKVHEHGVKVKYDITFTFKERRLYKGDLHIHTLGSDGSLSLDEVIETANKIGLDYVCITDHNNYEQNFYLPETDCITVIPGMEWTHYKGHALMLGVKKPYEGSFHTNDKEKVKALLKEASENGAIVSLNHPFDANCPWKWGFEDVYFDCVEIWNGVPRVSELVAINWWHQQLCQGKKIPAVGGSDFHKTGLFSMIGSPATCVYANSRGISDIKEAIRKGHSFITIAPDGPQVDISCGSSFMGDTVSYEENKQIHFSFKNLSFADKVNILTENGVMKTIDAAGKSEMSISIAMEKVKFYRAEIYRTFAEGVPPMPALVSNPLYISY